MRYITLTESEEILLLDGFKHHPRHHFRKRCQALLLSNEKTQVKLIAQVLKVRTRTIYTWMDNWEAKGIEGLEIKKGRGKKARLIVLDKDLTELVKKKP